MNRLICFLVSGLFLLLVHGTEAWSSTSTPKGCNCRPRQKGKCSGYNRSTSTTTLSLFGWFQSKDEEKNEAGSSDEDVSANLSGVAGIMGSMSKFKTSQRISDRTTAALQDLANTAVDGTAAEGKVKVTFNGQQRPMEVQIDEAYFQSLGRKTGAGELNAALTEAMQEAHQKSSQKMEDKLKNLYSDLGFDTT